jgi:hypothetical protein
MIRPKLVGGLVLLLAGLLVLPGCATMRAYQAESAKWQALADQATGNLHAGPVTVRVIAGRRGVYHCQSRQIDLGTDMPEASVRFLLAHELGHHLAGDCAEGVMAAELAANETAIQVLQVWGLSDYQAAREVARMLWLLAKEQVRQGRGHDACAELVAILRAHLAVTAPTDGTCSAELARQ